MSTEALLAAQRGRRLRVGLAGAGEFGRSFLYRSGRAAALEVVAVAEREPERARAVARAAGLAVDGLAIVADGAELAALALDLVVEATGDPESAARTAEAALRGGKHVAMVTKEADCVVGPILQAKARAAGLVCTPVDGDQPSLLVALVARARLLGLEVVCAGKAGEFDYVWDPARGTVRGPSASMPFEEAWWREPAARAAAFAAWPRATVPDYCELAIVANATGLAPDLPGLHAPVARTPELPNLFRPRAAGGLLAAPGALDMFVCLRREDEASFAGGVFVTVRCDDRASWEVLKGKGIPVSDDLGTALLHNPVHLLGIEAPVSLLAAAFLGVGAARLEPLCDVHARATRALAAGSRLAIGARHEIPGIEALLGKAGAAAAQAPLPYYLAAGCTLRREVPAGALVTRDMVEPPADSVLWRLRAEQDARFFA